MKLARPTGSLLLTALALCLALVFSASCIVLILSGARLSAENTANMRRLLQLENFRVWLDQMGEAVFPPPADLDAGDQGREDAYARAAEELDRIETSGPGINLRGDLEELRQALDHIRDAAVELLASPPVEERVRLELRFHKAKKTAHHYLASAVNTIREREKATSAQLGENWRWLNILATLGLGTAILLVVLLGLARADAARHRRSERELRLAKDQLRSLLEAVPDVMIVLDAEGRYWKIYTSQPQQLVGPADALLGRTIHEVLPPEDAASLQQVIDRAVRTGETQYHEYPLEIAGERRWFSARVVRFAEAEGTRVLWVARDLTDRRRDEEALRESEARFRQLAENVDDVVWLSTWTGRGIAYVSPAYERLWGRSCQSLYEHPQSWQDAIHPEDRARVVESFERTAHLGRYGEEFRIVRDDGTVRWVRDRAFPIRDRDGRVYRIAGISEDVTERRNAERALRESEQKFRAVAETAADAIVSADAEGRITYFNSAAERLFGYTGDEAIGRSLTLLMPERFHDRHLDGLEGRRATGEGSLIGRTMEVAGRRRDGREFPVEISLASWRSGGSTAFTAIIRDITDRKRTEQELRDLNIALERRVADRTVELRRLNETLEQRNRELNGEIAERVRAQEVQHAHNRMLERLAAGASLEEVLELLARTAEEVQPGMLASVLLLDQPKKRLHFAAAPSLPAGFRQAVDGIEIGPGAGSCGTAAYTGKRVVVEDIESHPYGAPVRELARKAGVRACWSEPIVSADNEILGTFAVYYARPRGPTPSDLEFIASAAHLAGLAIERKRAEAELHESRARLEVAGRLASLGTLTAGLGHDMNNILLPIRCHLEALDGETLPRKVAENLEGVRNSIDYLRKLADGLKLLARPDTEEVAETTTLAEWWGQVEPLMTPLLRPDTDLRVEIPRHLPPVAVPPHRLTQAVQNLVDNAVDAMTPGGGRIRIWARVEGRERVRLGVTDQGVGMSEEVRRRAFDPFFTTKKRGVSTGMGLSLVHHLMTRSGATVGIQSAPGRGTTVLLSLPTAAEPQRGEAPPPRPRGKAVVSLSDERRAAWVSSLLSGAGFEVARSPDGGGSGSLVWVTEPTPSSLEQARRDASNGGRRIIVLGAAGDEWSRLGALVVEDVESLPAITAAVQEVIAGEPGSAE